MITGWILDFFHSVASAVFGWCHDNLPGAPTFWTDATTAVNTAYGLIPSSIRYFVPIGPLVVAAGTLLGIVVLLGAIRLARRVVSLFSGGGGMA